VANIKSAEKRNRQRLQRRERNQSHLSTMRTYVKRVRTALEAKGASGKADLADVLKKAIRQIDKAAQKGVIDKKAASRKISRLTLAVRRAGASA
jgi:small subunit ribosomal protein S20